MVKKKMFEVGDRVGTATSWYTDRYGDHGEAGKMKYVFYWLSDKFSNEQPNQLWYLDQNEIDYLTCSPNKNPLTWQILPAQKKTLRLRYQDLKAKVCRPFSA